VAKSSNNRGIAGSRRRAIIGGAIAVVALAIVITLAVALSPGRSPEPQGPQQEQISDASLLIGEAESALASGDATRAVTLAKQALDAEPASAQAQDIITRAQRTQQNASAAKPASEPAPDPAKKPATDEDSSFAGEVKDMAGLLPARFTGFALGDVAVTESEAQVSATPEDMGAAAAQVVWVVHETKDSKAAERFLVSTSKELYAQDARTVDVDGAKAYFGTDGTRYATATYVRGRYVFEVLIASTEVDPAKNRAVAVKAAQAFADAPD
jgi:hypothetical protein